MNSSRPLHKAWETSKLPHSASAFLPLPNTDHAFHRLWDHIEQHDVVVSRPAPRELIVHVGESTISIAARTNGLALSVKAPSQSILFFLKEAAVRHLEDIDATAAGMLRWRNDAGFREPTGHPPSFHEMTVVRRCAPFPGMLRLTLSDMRDFQRLCGAGVHVKLMLPSDPNRAPVWPRLAPNDTTVWPSGADNLHVRYYTIKAIRPELSEIDIDVVHHDGGTIATWAACAEIGDRIGLLGPGGGEDPDDAETLLLAGDETALPALARMLETLQSNVRGHLIGAAQSVSELKAYLPDTRLTLHALPAADFSTSVAKLAEDLGNPVRPDFAWFAGEHKNAQELRRVFKKSFGLPKGRQYSISYWRRGDTADAR